VRLLDASSPLRISQARRRPVVHRRQVCRGRRGRTSLLTWRARLGRPATAQRVWERSDRCWRRARAARMTITRSRRRGSSGAAGAGWRNVQKYGGRWLRQCARARYTNWAADIGPQDATWALTSRTHSRFALVGAPTGSRAARASSRRGNPGRHHGRVVQRDERGGLKELYAARAVATLCGQAGHT
jgi:hypothetical protein